MRHLSGIIFSFCFLLFSGCTIRNETHSALEKTDSLLQTQSLAGAELQLNRINSATLSEGERAYYYLLLTEYYKEKNYSEMPDSLINFSIAYFKRVSDTEKLIRAYCLRSHFLYDDTEKSSEVMLQLKNAEELAEKLKNDRLLVQVYSCLYRYNLYYDNMNKALSYARKTKRHARLLGDNRWIGFANQSLFIVFYKLDIPDSINYYINHSLPYAKYQPLRNQPLFYNNIAVYYIENKEIEKAQSYLSQSLSICPHPHTYYLLAKIYTMKGDVATADALWQKALQAEEKDTYIDILEEYGTWLKQQGRFKEAADISARSVTLKDSLLSRPKSEHVLNIQHQYDKERTENRLRNYISGLFVVLVFLFLLAPLLWKRHKRKVHVMGKEIMDVHSRLSSYEKALADLTENNQTHREEIAMLQSKIATLRNKYKDILQRGSRLYDSIEKGGDMSKWNRYDMSCFIEYVQSKEFPVSASLDKYKTLTINQKIFLILQDMGMNEDRIKRIMHLSSGAFRTMSSRLNKKLKEYQ
ncbi:MAG: hypothetical protein J6I60_01275 [Bacteroidaceae bacterium]|nr:hypothetical protein [Bacteroidaceae bacterium]